ncbi:MAG: 5-(carboxyamino)imidazole ribonucleotide mutase [Pseudomonadota bacterium]
MSATPLVSIVMGSASDLEVMRAAAERLKALDVPFELDIVSAHRTPDKMFAYGEALENRGIRAVIAGAGGAAHLPGMIAALTIVPVIGVPVSATRLEGMDSLLSIVQMPAGVPVATVAIDNADNAAILAAQIVGTSDAALAKRLRELKTQLKEKVTTASQTHRHEG